MLEDVALANRFRADGETVQSFAGGDVLRSACTGTGSATWSGDGPGTSPAGAASVLLPRLVAIVAWITALLVSGAGGVRAVVDIVAGDADWRVRRSPRRSTLAFAVQLWLMFRQVGNFGVLTAALYPIVTLAFVAVFGWSLVGTARGEVRWKGRTIRLRPGRAP